MNRLRSSGSFCRPVSATSDRPAMQAGPAEFRARLVVTLYQQPESLCVSVTLWPKPVDAIAA
jgi:hypothetical protein